MTVILLIAAVESIDSDDHLNWVMLTTIPEVITVLAKNHLSLDSAMSVLCKLKLHVANL